MEINGKSLHLLNIFDASQNHILKTSYITHTLEIWRIITTHEAFRLHFNKVLLMSFIRLITLLESESSSGDGEVQFLWERSEP